MTEKPSNATAALLEEQVSAFIDGELSSAEHAQILQLLEADPEARAILLRLRHGSEIGNTAFAVLLQRLRPSLALHPGGKPEKGPRGRR